MSQYLPEIFEALGANAAAELEAAAEASARFLEDTAARADAAAAGITDTDHRIAKKIKEIRSTSASVDSAYHYNYVRVAESIRQDGLLEGSYATPDGDLGPLQALLQLSLPPNRRLPEMVVEIDLAGLREAGYEIPEAKRVSNVVKGRDGRAYSMPGGGYEMKFSYKIPPEFVKSIRMLT